MGGGGAEEEREGKDDFQDSGFGDLGITTSGPMLGNTRGRSGPRRKTLSFKVLVRPTRGDGQWVTVYRPKIQGRELK